MALTDIFELVSNILSSIGGLDFSEILNAVKSFLSLGVLDGFGYAVQIFDSIRQLIGI